jgi:hypothetical protein
MPERLLHVRVRAGARVRSLEELPDGTILIKTTTAPEKGRANKDVVDMLSAHLDVPKSCISLIRGETSSKKVFKIMA